MCTSVRSLPSFADRPYDERLTATNIASCKDLLASGDLVVLLVGSQTFKAAARHDLKVQIFQNIILYWARKSHGEKHKLSRQLVLRAGDRLQSIVDLRIMEFFNFAVPTGKTGRGDRVLNDCPLSLAARNAQL